MTPEEQRKQDSEEAASLQTYLMTNWPECRPEFPAGLFAWAEAALKAKATDGDYLRAHVDAAYKRAKGRDAYCADVLAMIQRYLDEK